MAEFEIQTGYTPGVIGRVAELHARYYASHWNFGAFFEARVAGELAEFIRAYDESKDRIWSILRDGAIEGSITVDGGNGPPGLAHFRWFILSDALRGRGAGNRLMDLAVAFCREKGYKRAYLWTFQGLAPARHLYEKHGFRLVEEHPGGQWGTKVVEQRFELELE